MMDFSEAITSATRAALVARNEQIEDAIMAAWLAHLPVDHVRHGDSGLLTSDIVCAWEVVLPGGHVFASGGIRVRHAAI